MTSNKESWELSVIDITILNYNNNITNYLKLQFFFLIFSTDNPLSSRSVCGGVCGIFSMTSSWVREAISYRISLSDKGTKLLSCPTISNTTMARGENYSSRRGDAFILLLFVIPSLTKHFRGHRRRTAEWLNEVKRKEPKLFTHWALS